MSVSFPMYVVYNTVHQLKDMNKAVDREMPFTLIPQLPLFLILYFFYSTDQLLAIHTILLFDTLRGKWKGEMQKSVRSLCWLL